MKTKRTALIVAVSLGFITACTSTGTKLSDATRSGLPADPKGIVLAFYEQALVKKNVRAAFERFASGSFVEHKPDVPVGDRESAVRYLEQLVSDLPAARWEVLRSVAEGDLVFLHARFVPAPGAPPYAIADIFRVRDGLIVEHWDVVAAPPKESVNPTPRF